LRGFLNGLHDTSPKLVEALLDEAVDNDVLAQWYPILQTAVGIDNAGVERLMRSLRVGKSWIRMYRNLAMGGVSHRIDGQDFNRLLLQIAEQPGGWDVAVEIFWMRLSFEEGRKQSSISQIVQLGCELMRRLTFTDRRSQGLDYRLEMIARQCLVGAQGATTVREICNNLGGAIKRSETYVFYQSDLLRDLFNTQPLAALETLCGDNEEDLKIGIGILEEAGELQRHAFDGVGEADLLSWCDQQPDGRYPAAAAGVTAFRPSSETGRPQWTSTARKLLDKAPDRSEVLRAFIKQFSPGTGNGSRAALVESNLSLLDELAAYPDPALVEFVNEEKERLSEAVRVVREMEIPIARVRDERFE
jgi:hypothetical protein